MCFALWSSGASKISVNEGSLIDCLELLLGLESELLDMFWTLEGGRLPLLLVDVIDPRKRLLEGRLDYALADRLPLEDEAAVVVLLLAIDLLFLRTDGLYRHRLSDSTVGLHVKCCSDRLC